MPADINHFAERINGYDGHIFSGTPVISHRANLLHWIRKHDNFKWHSRFTLVFILAAPFDRDKGGKNQYQDQTGFYGIFH